MVVCDSERRLKIGEGSLVFKKSIQKLLHRYGYELKKIDISSNKNFSSKKGRDLSLTPPPIEPIWPLPRRSDGLFSDEEICREFAKYDLWHYAYKFEGGVSFSAHHNNPGSLTDVPERPLQRFKHFMPYLIESQDGSLKGKRVLDIACNSGFWSIQCALLGAEVVGFDARAELIEQSNLIKSIIGINNVNFKLLDFWEMSPQSLDGTFDVVLNLGILYHLPNPLEALKLTKLMARKTILLDTGVYPSKDSVIKLKWEEPTDIRAANSAGIVAYPSKNGIDLMLRHINFEDWFEVPMRTSDMPKDYLEHRRASWLIKV
ncbi:methyltransferase domain-containing protein [Pleurocapsales cyanobacterium LEGE 06147]|nr:methyltransferase domain-containing protein [Pleurocapsales cyanobacterium LEGE 06147]